MVMESSSNDSVDNKMVEGEIESEDDDVAIVDEEHETSQTTSTISSAANNSGEKETLALLISLEVFQHPAG